MNAHHIGTQQPAAAPQDESDTHLHNQATPDVISSTPNAIPTPSSQHPVQQSHPVQLPQADSAYGVDPVSSTKGSRDGLAAVADSFQQSPDTSLASAQVSNQQPSTAAADTAQESHAHQQPASGPTAAAPADITAFASQLATEANASDQSQGSAGQLQQPAGNATSTSAQASSTSQQQHQPGELGLRPMQQHQDAVPSTAHQHSPSPSAADASQQASGGAAKIPASYQHQGFNPTDVPSQSEPHQAADPVQGRSDAVALAQPAAESVSTSKAPGVQLEGSSESRQGNAGQPETSPSQNVASQSSGARQQLDQPSTSRDEAASEGQNQMTSQTSQDDASASTSERQQPGDASVSRADRQEAVSDTEAADTAASESSNRRAEQNGTSGRGEGDSLTMVVLTECMSSQSAHRGSLTLVLDEEYAGRVNTPHAAAFVEAFVHIMMSRSGSTSNHTLGCLHGPICH